MNRETIPIVFAPDNHYAPMCGVAICSLMQNASKEYFYDIYILSANLDEHYKKQLIGLQDENFAITYIDVADYLQESKEHNSVHLSIATVYRLFIPELLPQYKKIIYLDSDIVVLNDISILYQYEIEEAVFGAIRDFVNKSFEEHSQVLGISSNIQFNAGILVINTQKFKELNIADRCFELLYEDWKKEKPKYVLMDQDVLNIVCRDKICYLPDAWNLPWAYCNGLIAPLEQIEVERYDKACQNPCIIHYAGGEKPWQFPEYKLADIFWDYARKTKFYGELARNGIRERAEKTNMFRKYLFPFELVKKHGKIVLYGAGNIGRHYYEQLQYTGYAMIVLWADKNFEQIQDKTIEVSSPKEILDKEYDQVVIAIENRNTAAAIKKELSLMGIPEEKIVWDNPCRA